MQSLTRLLSSSVTVILMLSLMMMLSWRDRSSINAIVIDVLVVLLMVAVDKLAFRKNSYRLIVLFSIFSQSGVDLY